MELKIIGSLLTDSDYMKYYYGKVKPEMFTNPLCREAYIQCLRLYDLNQPINITEIKKALEGTADNESILNLIKGCVAETIYSGAEARSCQKAICDRYKATCLRNMCNNLSFLPKDINTTIRELNKATEDMLKGSQTKGISLADVTKQYKDYYGHEHPLGIKTGLYEVDELLVGLDKGDVTVIGARPAVGKSALVTQILMNVADKGHRVGYFNLEMTDKQILERIISRYSGIDLLRLRKAKNFMTEEKAKYNTAIEKIENNKNLILFSGSYTVGEMKFLCKNQGFDLIVIDYLQLVKAEKTYGSREAEIGDISTAIKSMAMELKVPIIELSQLNRKIEATDEPSMNDLRESGRIEQDASNILLLWNIDEAGKTKALKIEKNRQGILGKVALDFDGSKMHFETINHKPFDLIVKERQGFKKITDDNCPF